MTNQQAMGWVSRAPHSLKTHRVVKNLNPMGAPRTSFSALGFAVAVRHINAVPPLILAGGGGAIKPALRARPQGPRTTKMLAAEVEVERVERVHFFRSASRMPLARRCQHQRLTLLQRRHQEPIAKPMDPGGVDVSGPKNNETADSSTWSWDLAYRSA